jgi:anti-sigma-K factor RskA
MTTPQEFHAMTGAYAVDALDDLERAAFEHHLAGCADCRAEVAGLREAAALLAESTAVEPPAALRDRVLAEIATVRPLPPASTATGPAPRRHGRMRLLVAAAAAVVLVGAGAVVWQQPWEDGTTQTPPVADQVRDAPDAKSTSLEFPGGASATITHSDSLHRAVITTRKMPAPPAGKVYQLWLDQPGKGMVSAGVMPVKEDQTVVLAGDAATATGAGITVEPEGGSATPTTEPIALFDFARSDA